MLIIRDADPEDAADIARVHVDTWRSAYRGILPASYLKSISYQHRAIAWARMLEFVEESEADVTLVSEIDDEIVGFVHAGHLRHRDPRFAAEINSLYVLKDHQRAGHGKRLFLAACNRLAQRQLKGLFVWVLADNPCREFYSSMGGELVANREVEFAKEPLMEYGYGWAQTPEYG